MIGIVVSRADSASAHIGEHLLDLVDWEEVGTDVYRRDGFELREFDEWHLELDRTVEAFSERPDLVVFASRHSGESGALLTAHFTGNFGEAEHGGADRDLAEACPNAQKRVLDALGDHAPDGYETGIECTHHGPTDVGAPSMFVELGSGEEQWEDPEAAEAVARAILALAGVDPHSPRTLVAFGGGHYVPRPTRVVKETDWRMGHIAADWCLDDLGLPQSHPDVVEQVFTESGAEHALVDGDHPDLAAVVDDLGYRIVSETWAREVDDVPLDAAEVLESRLTTVDDGLRFGKDVEDARNAVEAGDFVVRDLPDDLLAEAHGVDPDAPIDATADAAIAYETEENGNRVQGVAAFTDPADYEELVDELCALLREKYDHVIREDSEVVAEEAAFDPQKADRLGIPEGPKFGRLAAGESVIVNGEEIPPSAVRTQRILRFPI